MIIYRVTVRVDADIAGEWHAWMRDVHVPDVLATGCFSGHRLLRVLEPPTEGARGFVMEYHAQSLEDYERYRDHHAARLQQDHTDRYRGRFTASREILEASA